MEYIDIYDANQRKTGRIRRRGESLIKGEYILVVHACIMNPEGKMLIQKRSQSKNQYAGLWDLSAGGHARAGETSLEAVRREVWEELGLADSDGLIYLFTEPFHQVLDDIYYLKYEGSLDQLKWQTSEIEEIGWASCREILMMIKEGTFVDYTEDCIRKIFAKC